MIKFEAKQYIDDDGGLKGSKDEEIESLINNKNYYEFFSLIWYLEKKYPKAINYLNTILKMFPSKMDKESPFFYEKQRLQWRVKNLAETDFIKKKSQALDWLRICVNTDNDKHNNFYFDISSHDREQEVCNIIFDIHKKGTLHQYFKDGIGVNYTYFLISWFLKHYNLSTTTKIISKIFLKKEYSTHLSRFQELKKFGCFFTPLLFLVLIIMLVFSYSNVSIFQEISDRFISICSNIEYFENINLFTTILLWAYPLTFIFFFLSILKNFLLWFKIFLPRMIGGIVVGFFPLLFGEEAWKIINNLSDLEGSFLFIFSILFSGFYLYVEVHNTIKDKIISFFRALRVLCLGLIESFIVGLIIMDLITIAYTPLLKFNYEPIVGLFGVIYPKILILYFPLALLIGIFVQIIWEEKPITQPL